MTNHKSIDISKLNKKSIQKITYADLVSDAAARQDKDAYDFLCRINQETKDKPPHSRQRIQTIRNEYLHTFCGYGKPTPQPHPQSVHEQQQMLLESVECCYTNEYFAHLLGVGLSSVKSSLNRLYQKHILDHRTYTVSGNGRANRQRVLTVKPPIVWDLAA